MATNSCTNYACPASGCSESHVCLLRLPTRPVVVKPWRECVVKFSQFSGRTPNLKRMIPIFSERPGRSHSRPSRPSACGCSSWARRSSKRRRTDSRVCPRGQLHHPKCGRGLRRPQALSLLQPTASVPPLHVPCQAIPDPAYAGGQVWPVTEGPDGETTGNGQCHLDPAPDHRHAAGLGLIDQKIK
jgi:hypothetical protein